MSDSYGRNPYGRDSGRQRSKRRPSGLSLRLLIALGIVGFSLIGYLGKTDVNQITGEKQRVAISEEEEIRMGLQAMPQLAQQHGGLHPDRAARRDVDEVGRRLVNALQHELANKNVKIPYQFDFHLLADSQTVNAFALPGGQVFITYALYNQLESQAQLAGVLGHEIGHVIERHGAQRMAKAGFYQGVAKAAAVYGGTSNTSSVVNMMADLRLKGHSREHELESDRWGVLLCVLANYNPRAMLGVMDILDRASGSGGPPEMMRTHPKPANRKEYIEDRIREYFPKGLPPGLVDRRYRR